MPIIKARSSSIINSVDLRGTPTAPTASQGTHTTQVATTDFVSTAVTDLINGAPSILDTLSELATAINNDQSFAVTITSLIGTKVALAGDTMTGTLVLSGDPVNNLDAVTKQYVDTSINAQMIYSTDDVPEGTTNLYYTDTRVHNAISLTSDNTVVLDYNPTTGIITYNHPNSDGILEGSANKYFTDTRARNSISLTSDDSQILSYGASTGTFTFTTPSTDKIIEGTINKYFTTARARGAISNGSNIDYDSATGIISTPAAVWSVNTQTHDVVLDTDNIDEGMANLYFTNTRARSAVSLTTDNSNILSYNTSTGVLTWVTPSTDAIGEGTTNKYYTTARTRADVSASGDISYNQATGNFSYSTPTTDGVNEGSINLYFTNARARQAVSLTTSNADILAYDNTTGEFTFQLSHLNTDEIAEGTNHLYFTNARARAAISANSNWTNVSYDSTTGILTVTAPTTDDVVEGTNLYYTDTRVRNAITVSDTGGDGSLTFDNTTGTFTYTGPSDSEVRAHFSALSNTGITYDSTMGQFALEAIPNGSLAHSSINILGADVHLGDSITFSTDDVVEGMNNLYYTQGRFDTAFGAKTTSDLAEGTNLYYTQGRFDTAFGDKSTDDLGEGTTNKYYTTARTRADVSGGTGVTYTQATGVFAIGQDVSTTSNVTFNDVVVSGDLTVNGTMTAVNSTTVTIADKNLTLASGAASAAQADGAGITVDGANATLNYLSGADRWETNKGLYVNGNFGTSGSAQFGAIDNTPIGQTTPAAGTFTTLADTSLTTGRVVIAGTDGALIDDSNLTFAAGTLTSNDLVANGSVTASTVIASTLTQGRVTFTGANHTLTDDAGLTFAAGVLTSTAGFAGPLTGNVTGNVTGNLTGNVTGQVSDLSNHTTNDVAEGTTNLYYTTARTRADVSATSSTGVTYDSATGTFSLASIPNASLTNSSVTVNGSTVSLGGTTTFGTDAVSEGMTNLYFTNTRARQAVSLTTSNSNVLSYDNLTGTFVFDLSHENTDQIAEGMTNLYFTQARARASISATGWSNLSYDSASGVITISAPSTDDVTEGADNKYFTNTRARQAISLTTDNTDALSYDNTTGQFTFTLNSVYTDEIAEGQTSLYFTTARARSSVSNGANIDYDAATGIISTQAAVWSVNGASHDVVLTTDNIDEGTTNLYFTNARAASAISLLTDNSSILSYAQGTGVLTWVTPSTDAITEGATNLYYTNTRVTDLLGVTSINALSDVDLTSGLSDGYSLVWSAAQQNFVPQNVTISSVNLNFTGDGTQTTYSTNAKVETIDNTQVYINGLIQAPTYSYTLSTVDNISSIVFDQAPEANDYIMIKVIASSQLSAGGILNEQSSIDGGTY